MPLREVATTLKDSIFLRQPTISSVPKVESRVTGVVSLPNVILSVGFFMAKLISRGSDSADF